MNNQERARAIYEKAHWILRQRQGTAYAPTPDEMDEAQIEAMLDHLDARGDKAPAQAPAPDALARLREWIEKLIEDGQRGDWSPEAGIRFSVLNRVREYIDSLSAPAAPDPERDARLRRWACADGDGVSIGNLPRTILTIADARDLYDALGLALAEAERTGTKK